MSERLSLIAPNFLLISSSHSPNSPFVASSSLSRVLFVKHSHWLKTKKQKSFNLIFLFLAARMEKRFLSLIFGCGRNYLGDVIIFIWLRANHDENIFFMSAKSFVVAARIRIWRKVSWTFDPPRRLLGLLSPSCADARTMNEKIEFAERAESLEELMNKSII